MKDKFSHWFSLWHPNYRWWMFQLFLAGTFAAGLIFFESVLIDALTQSLALTGERSLSFSDTSGDPARQIMALASQWNMELALAILLIFVATVLIKSLLNFWWEYGRGKLRIRGKNDLEKVVLNHLLQRDSQFFTRHSSGEIINRIFADVPRIARRRTKLMKAWLAGGLIAGYLFYFFLKDWRLAVMAVITFVIGIAIILSLVRPVQKKDRSFLTEDDNVKSSFEDLLQASSEIQSGHFYSQVLNRFEDYQVRRSESFMNYTRLKALLKAVRILTPLLAFGAMVTVIIYIRRGGGHVELAVVPVIIKAIPDLFKNAARLVFVRLDFRLAANSMDRLLEYESSHIEEKEGRRERDGEDKSREEELEKKTQPVTLRLEGASFQYTSQFFQGGAVDIEAEFSSGQWTAITGEVGAGKSTFLEMALGRLRPQKGQVFLGEENLHHIPPEERARYFSYMPQKVSFLNDSLGKNLFFHRFEEGPIHPQSLTADQAELLETLGLGQFSRLKALYLSPSSEIEIPWEEDFSHMRKEIRSQIEEECSLEIFPYEEGNYNSTFWMVENLVGAICERNLFWKLTEDKSMGPRWEALAKSDFGKKVIALGREVIKERRHLLNLSNYHLFCQLAPFSLEKKVWELRVNHLHLLESENSSSRPVPLFFVGLTALPLEGESSSLVENFLDSSKRKAFEEEIHEVKNLIESCLLPLDFNEIQGRLSWRENLIFGRVKAENFQLDHQVDHLLLDWIKEKKKRIWFTCKGMEFQVGTRGERLSSGQKQLVTICRTLLRDTPLLAFDEPTASLDVKNRQVVADLFEDLKKEKTIITVTHDRDLLKRADVIYLMEKGHISHRGSYEKLKEESQVFSEILNRQK